MGSIIKTEFKKMKGSSMFWIGLGGCFILPLMALGINISNPSDFTWIQYVQQNLWPQIILLWPCIFGVFGSYIICREHIENTYKNLLLIPVSRIQIVISKLLVMFVSIMAMVFLTYILNLSGMFIGVTVSVVEFFEGLKMYAMAGFLVFVCILPVMLISILARKGFLLSVCISIVYALASFLGSWMAPLAALLPLDVAWRIMDLQQFEMNYSFPMSISLISFVLFAVVSVIGIFYASNRQEA